MKTAIASAPGKILWIGGYSVLEKPNVSFVTGINKRVYAKAKLLTEPKAVFNLPQFNTKVEGIIEKNSMVFNPPLSDKDAADSKFVRFVADICLKYARSKGKGLEGFEITTVSDAVFGSGGAKTGLGSSAAVAVATTAALMQAFGFKLNENKDLIHRIAQFAHSKAQGKVGSGFDITAATFGGCAYSRYSPSIINNVPENASAEQVVKAIDGEWDYTIKEVELPLEWVSVIAFTGRSASTSAMVKKVNEFKAAKPSEYTELIKQINEANKKAIEALEKIREITKFHASIESATALKEFQDAFDEGRVLTKKLGDLSDAPIEPPEFTEAIELAKRSGAFVAKLPGAGGGDSIAALCLSKDRAKNVADAWAHIGYKILDLNISNEGVREEPAKKFEAKVAEVLKP